MDVLSVIKRSPLVFAAACVAAASIVVVSEASYSRAILKLDSLETYAIARTNLRDVRLDLLDAETGQRGYLLTGEPSYLEPYQKAVDRIAASLARLDGHYLQDSAPKILLDQLHELAKSKLSELATTIELHRSGDRDQALNIVMGNSGQAQMDVIRDVTAQLLDLETKRIAGLRADLYENLLLSRIGLGLLSVTSLLALFLFLRQNFVLKQQQLELKRIVQTESDRLGLLVNERTLELVELNQHLQTAREDERNRLARNLHDDLGALLTSAKLDAARIKRRLLNAPPETMERLNHLEATLNSSVALGRSIIEDLRPSTLSNFGLITALEVLLREFAERSGVKIICDLDPAELTEAAELVVYRMVQEAITNISKYAEASTVWVCMKSVGTEALVSVRDDGLGFDTTAGSQSAYGLVGMHYRVAAERGKLSVVSSKGAGTTLTLTLPEIANQS
jgi:signal transduction histidine kinase